MLNFDTRCLSEKFTIHSRLHLYQKRLLMWFILLVVLQRKVRFLTTVYVVLEQHNNCL